MGHTFNQFVHFGTDIVGLERFLRLIQSLAHILCSAPTLLALILALAPSSQGQTPPQPDSPPFALAILSTTTAILQLRNKLNLARRTLRLFRFLDSFRLAGARLASGPAGLGAAASLDAASLSLLGVYGLLESATLPDAYNVPLLGAARAQALNLEAQRCWFAALGCAVVASGLRLFGASSAPVGGKAEKSEKSEGGAKDGVSGSGRGEKTANRGSAKKDMKVGQTPGPLERGKLVWKIAADGLDMVLPASALGWVPAVEQWMVGSAMLVTTILTGRDVWERCGRDVRLK